MGVGLTGLIEPLNSGAFPVFEDINGLGGFRAEANAAARDAIPANSRKIGMQVVLQDTGIVYQLVGGITNADWRVGGGASQAFKGTFYINPAFTGIQTGSQSNPFTTIAAAFAFAVSLGLTGAVINLPPRTTITENVTFPSGGRWELRGLSDSPYGTSSSINGTVDVSDTSGAGFRTLTNLFVFGAVSGNNSAATPLDSTFQSTNCLFFSTVVLTTSSTAKWIAIFRGQAQKSVNSWGGACSALTSVSGEISAINWAFLADIGYSFNSYFDSCDFGGGANVTTTITTTTSVQGNYFGCCDWHTVPVFTVVGGGTVTILADSTAMSRLIRRGTVPTGNISFSSLNSHVVSANAALTDNIGPSNIANGVLNTPLLVAEAVITLLTPGTAGAALVNIIYTDYAGIVQTRAITAALNIAGVAGDSVSGVLPFSQNGATIVGYSVTGIVTPGALVYRLDFSVRVAS